MTFKEKLIILRKSKGLTQDDFASAVGVSRQAVYKWESGQSYPEVPKLLEMKLLFSVSIDELLDDSYDLPVPEKKKRKRAPKENAAPKAPKAAPVAKPAPAPKAAPVAQPAPAPKAAPVAQPAPAPKAAPVAQPAPAPKAAPVAQPAPAPKAAPVAQPAPAPVAQPAPAPVAQPAPAPVAQPAPAPVAQPAPAPKAEEPKVDTVPNPILLEDIVADDENKADKKGGFFDRLFGRR